MKKFSDRFIDQELISSTKFSDIYKATDQKTGGIVALKITVPDEELQPHNSIQEVQLLKKTNHSENIIQILDTSKRDFDELVIVLPYYQLTLSQYMKKNSKIVKKAFNFNPFLLRGTREEVLRPTVYENKLGLSKSKSVVKGIANGLSFLHSNEIIHRDIKPSNIMFKSIDDPTPTIIDLGISFQYPTNNGKEFQNEKVTDVSTGIYKPPECIFGLKDYSYPMDIWSLGILMTLIFSNDLKACIEEEKGSSDISVIYSLFKLFGKPDCSTWPEASNSPTFANICLEKQPPIKPVSDLLELADNETKEVFMQMMVYESKHRITADGIYGAINI